MDLDEDDFGFEEENPHGGHDDDMSFGDDSRGEICTVWSGAVYYSV